MTFGKYLKKIRSDQGFSLRKVEKLTGVSNSYISQIESGSRENPPSPKILKKLAIAYNISFDELMTTAGYLSMPLHNYPEEVLSTIFNFLKIDPRFEYGKDVPDTISKETILFIIELYEKATKQELLPRLYQSHEK